MESREPKLVMLGKQVPTEETVTVPAVQMELIKGELTQARTIMAEMEKLAVFIREHYHIEIAAEQRQHLASAADAAIHYMKIERSRWKIRIRYFLAAIERLGSR
jgi:hypothetical protein